MDYKSELLGKQVKFYEKGKGDNFKVSGQWSRDLTEDTLYTLELSEDNTLFIIDDIGDEVTLIDLSYLEEDFATVRLPYFEVQ